MCLFNSNRFYFLRILWSNPLDKELQMSQTLELALSGYRTSLSTIDNLLCDYDKKTNSKETKKTYYIPKRKERKYEKR